MSVNDENNRDRLGEGGTRPLPAILVKFLHHVGQELTAEIEVQIQASHPGPVRYKKPGQFFTADFNMTRLNVVLSSNDIVSGFELG